MIVSLFCCRPQGWVINYLGNTHSVSIFFFIHIVQSVSWNLSCLNFIVSGGLPPTRPLIYHYLSLFIIYYSLFQAGCPLLARSRKCLNLLYDLPLTRQWCQAHWGKMQTKTETDTDTDTDTQTHRHKHTDTDIHRHTDTQTQTHTDIHRHTQTHRQHSLTANW